VKPSPLSPPVHPAPATECDDAHRKTVADLFRAGIVLEKRVGAIYGQLARRFDHHREVFDFWKGMQADEIGHAEALDQIRAALTAADLARPVDAKTWSGAADLERFLARDRVGPVKTLDDAYLLAHEIEFSEINAIFKFLAAKSIPFEDRADFVISQLSQHQEKITSFGRTFGDRAWRRRIAAKA
jgi:hypothetical protein